MSDFVTAQGKMTPLTMLELFEQAQTPPNAADADQLYEIYNGSKNNSSLVDDVQLQLGNGNVAAVTALVAAGKKTTGWTKPTTDALTAVIEANTVAPSAADVTAELEKMGFEFVDGRWVSVL